MKKSTEGLFHHPIARTGFRPFFLLAALLATLWLPLWLLVLKGKVAVAGGFEAALWHGHEMIFGYAVAVIAGFLLTAVRHWTGRETAKGAFLLFLAALWFLGRVTLLFAGSLPAFLPAVVDVAFLPMLALVIARPIVAAKRWMDLPFPVILLLMAAANLASHLGSLGLISFPALRSIGVGLDLILLLVALVGGRVMPHFARFVLKTPNAKNIPLLDRIAIVSLALIPLLDLMPGAPGLMALVAITAGIAGAARMAGWCTREAIRTPALMILHLAYFWLAAGLVLKGIAAISPSLVAPSVATHALTVGALGTLTLGMMCWVGRVHTGRPVIAPPPILIAYFFITAAALIRVGTPLAAPGRYLLGIDISGAFWSAAFAIYLVVYLPILLAPAMGGKTD